MADLINDDELLSAIELLYFGYRSFTSKPDEILAKRGLRRVHHRILYFVGRNDSISVNALLGILSVSKQALNAPLRRLVELGLISNNPSPHDRRVKALRLTANGRKLERQLSGIQMRQLKQVFEELGDDKESAWREVMLKLAN